MIHAVSIDGGPKLRYSFLVGLVYLLLSSVGTTAQAREPVPAPAYTGGSDSRSLHRDFMGLFIEPILNRCVLDDMPNLQRSLAEFKQRAQRLKEPLDRENFKDYFPVLEAWLAKQVAGVPGVGTWPELKARFADLERRAQVTMPALTADPASIEAGLAAYADYTKVDADAAQFAELLAKETNCSHQVGDLPTLRGKLLQRREEFEKPMINAMRTVLSELNAFEALSKPTYDASGTWSEATQKLGAITRALIAARAILRKEKLITAFAAWSRVEKLDSGESDAGAAWRERLARARMIEEAAPAYLVKETSEIGLPKLAKSGAQASAFATHRAKNKLGKIVVGPVYVPGAAKQKFEETEGGRKYPYTRHVGTAYYVAQDSEHTKSVTLTQTPGVPDGGWCEIRWLSFFRYQGGPPSFRNRQQWEVSVDEHVAPIPCAKAKVVAKRPL
ncbi:MAG: hypothetical protein SFX73_34475 [Kofleriaceae bacterium]|nr:hypothetical protein [Kofleriaceae bacterium]